MHEEYTGCPNQCSGVEEYRLVGGRGDNMPLYEVRNGQGLEFTVSPSRGMDISRLSFRGWNCSFMSPAGYTAPEYFRAEGMDFLKSFTCGFLTTCGLRNVGPPCQEQDQRFGLHGTIGNCPADHSWYDIDSENIRIRGKIRDEVIFGEKLQLDRTICCSRMANHLEIHDRITNTGDRHTPLMILYHFNSGYPLLDEDAQLYINSDIVVPRDQEAEKGINSWHVIERPQPQYQEQCFYHSFAGQAKAGIFQNKLNIGFFMSYNPKCLPKFTQWKMMGVRDYVMGLEPGNCNPESRSVLRSRNELDILAPGEQREFEIAFDFYDSYEKWNADK